MSEKREGYISRPFPPGRLTDTEIVVLKLASQGKRNDEIARELGNAAATIHNHLTNIYRKLNAQNRVEAIFKGIEYGYIKPPIPMQGSKYLISILEEIQNLIEARKDELREFDL